MKEWVTGMSRTPDTVSATIGVPPEPPPLAQDYEIVDAGSIQPHPDNARRGNLDAIRESIQVNGFYGACIVQRSTGHILVGNHRYMAAVDSGLTDIPVMWVDKTDAEARRLLLVDNRTTDLAGYDTAALVAILNDQAEQDDLPGTGWDDAALAALLAAIEDEPPEDFPSFGEDIPVDLQCPKCGYEWS
jgi:ParB-like chromosome segregation protein Spo0J